MSGYFNAAQHAKLLEPINPGRVGRDRNNRAHVEAYEIRAHLNRLIGFGRWSQTVTAMELIFETLYEDASNKKEQERVSVAYRAHVELAVHAPDGTRLAAYSEWAMGDASNFPRSSRGDAHDFAIKTAESQGLKRCAMNLGDQFGLSLYKGGSVAGLVHLTMVPADGTDKPAADASAVDAHVTASVPESEVVEDKRETNPPQAAPQPRTIEASEDDEVTRIQTAALNPPADANAPYFARLQMEATKAGVMKKLTDDGQGNVVTVGALIQSAQRRRPAA